MKWARWFGPAIFVVALALRIVGIGWGLPNDLHNESYHPDEPINVHFAQRIEPLQLKFTPGFYSYGTLFLTLFRIAALNHTMGDNFAGHADQEEERAAILAGRVISALAGAGCCWVLFCLLMRRTHPLGAAFGALALAVSPAFVVHSRFATVDVTATFFFTLSILFALRLLPDQAGIAPSHFIRWAVLAGVFAGLSAGTKYTGGIGLVGVYAAIIYAKEADRVRLAVLATAAAVLAFLISTPAVLLDTTNFVAGLQYEMVHIATGQGLVFVDTPPAAIEHIFSLEIGIGFLVFIFGLFGLGYAAFKRYPWAIVVLAFSIPYYLIISRGEVKYLRYTFPLYPAICGGFGWIAGQAHLRRDQRGRIVAGAGIIALGMQALQTNQFTFWMVAQDPRDQAGQFFKGLGKTQPNLSVGVTDDPWFYTPALYKDVPMTRAQWFLEGPQIMAQATQPKVVYYRPFQDPNTKPDYVTYSTLKSYDLERLKDARDLSSDNQALIDQWKATQAALANDYTLYACYGGVEPPRIYREDLEYVHPYVYIWKRKDLP